LTRADWLASTVVLASGALAWLVGVRGYFWSDDWVVLAGHANEGLNVSTLFAPHGGHIQPASYLIFWFATLMGGGTPWVVMTAICTLIMMVASGTTWLALRALVGARSEAVIALAVASLSVLSYTSTSWVIVGVTVVPVWAAGAMALYFVANYVRLRRRVDLWGVVLSVVVGLFFLEKAVIIPIVLFCVVTCWFIRGGLVSTLRTSWREFRMLWLALAAISGLYLVGYALQAQESAKFPAPLVALRAYLGAYVETFPWIVTGGPWNWASFGQPNADAAPPLALGILAAVATGSLVGVSILLRRHRVRIWLPWFIYVAIATSAIVVGRVSALGWPVVHTFRHYADGGALLACTLAVAFLGLREQGLQENRRIHIAQTTRTTLRKAWIVGPVLGLLLLSTGMSALGYQRLFGNNPARTYSDNYQGALVADPGVRLFNGPPPGAYGLLFPIAPFDTRQEMFKVYDLQPEWVEQASALDVIDDSGNIVPGSVFGADFQRGDAPGCGTIVVNELKLPAPTLPFSWTKVIYLNYLSKTDTLLSLTFGGQTVRVPLKAGAWGKVYVQVPNSGEDVELVLPAKSDAVCLNQMELGVPGVA